LRTGLKKQSSAQCANYANLLMVLSGTERLSKRLSLPISNGQTEGHVNRLKLLKRQMYGRARFDLLRLRVIHAA